MDNDFDIAIVGMACHFPGARNLKEFWQNLVGGVESITRLSDQEILEAGVPEEFLARPDYVKAAPVLDDPSLFDAAFFGFAPSEAEAMDPQHRLLLELAHASLEDAGCDPRRFPGRVGVFAGSAMNTYFMSSGLDARFAEEYIPTLIVNDKDFLATRVSYKLGLRGPSMTVQTACSTSLVAIHLARQSLLNEETDMALAGTVSVRVPHRAGYFYDGGGVVSPDGHVRAFDAGANGTVFGSGAGVIVMRRLADAIAHGDPIHAVIKGSAVNNDGCAKAGYTAPSVNGQADVIVEALANAGVDAETLSYVEAHGSGTPVGDPIEILALTKAFRKFTQQKGFCAIGSVKTNIGHLDAAAGMAGLIKTVLALKHRRLPPTLHYSKANPEINFPASPFFVNTATMEWAQGGTPRRAGVMSTGMGGTNAHIILEEAPVAVPAQVGNGPHLLLLSAKTPVALQTMSGNLADFLIGQSSTDNLAPSNVPSDQARSGSVGERVLANVAYTLQKGRNRFTCRRFLVCNQADDAVAALRTPGSKVNSSSSVSDEARRPVIFMLPGVGDHYVGMGQGLYEHFRMFRDPIDRCAEVLRPLLNLDIRELLFPPNRIGKYPQKPRGLDLKRMLGRAADATTDPAAQRLDQTIHCQPVLFSVEYALARLWMQLGVQPERLVGHSMGEYVAACLAGVFSLEDALKLIAARARLVNDLPLGSMLAVMLPEAKLRPLLSEELSISLINGPELCVVAGPVAAMSAFKEQLEKQEIVVRSVRNAHAFHSKMLDPITESFAREIKQVHLNPPRIPFISNLTGTWITAGQAQDPIYWVDHSRRTARFNDCLEQMWKIPDCLALEVGPGRTLGVLAMQHPGRAAASNPVVLSSLRHDYENDPDAEVFLNNVGRLWLTGTEIDWENLESPGRRKISLPTYPFERQRHWVQSKTDKPSAQVIESQPEQRSDITDWFYIPSWERTGFPTGSFDKRVDQRVWLIIGEQSGLTDTIIKTLRERGATAVIAYFGKSYFRRPDGAYEIRAGITDDYLELLGALQENLNKPLNVLHLTVSLDRLCSSKFRCDERSQELGFYSLLNLAKAIAEQNVSVPICIGAVTSQVHEVNGDEELNPAMATVLGVCGVMPREYSNVIAFSVDLPALPRSQHSLDGLVIHLLNEFVKPSKGRILAYRGKYRWERNFKQEQLSALEVETEDETIRAQGLRRSGVYLITGGTGGIGLEIAKYLAKTCQARLVLIRRSPFLEKSIWRMSLTSAHLPESERHIIAELLEIEALGGEVEVFACEVSDKPGMERVVAKALAKYHSINGVIHAAGVVHDSMIEVKTRHDAESVLAPKVKGSCVLFDLFKDSDLDVMVFFSSLSSIVPLHGQCDYSAANCYLDAFSAFSNSHADFRTLSINWPGWREVGILTKLKAGTGLNGWMATTLRRAILTQDGVEVFRRALASKFNQLIVSPRDLKLAIEESREPLLEPYETNDSVSSVVTSAQSNTSDPIRPRSEFVAPRSVTEQALAGIWRDLLGVKQIGIREDFFELGGHSLLAVRLFSRIQKVTGKRLPLATLLESRTIEALAQLITEGSKPKNGSHANSFRCLVPIRTGVSKAPFFCIHGVGGNVLNYEALIRNLNSDQPVYAVQSRGLNDLSLDASVEKMASSYIKEIKRVQPKGPYLLGGQSFGGLVAYEIGWQLEAAGDEVGLVALIDTSVNYNADASSLDSFMTYLSLLWDRVQGHTRSVMLGPNRIGYLQARSKTLRRRLHALRIRIRLWLTRKSKQDLVLSLQKVWDVNYLSAFRYSPKPCKGAVTLFRCKTRSLGDHPDYLMGWRHLAKGGVHVEEVPGDHVTMLEEPHVRVVAEKLGACVKRASNRTSTADISQISNSAESAASEQ
jgi:acyl transferase domain-containing protein/thioesterase domain-containing protein